MMEKQNTKNTYPKNVFFLLLLSLALISGCSTQTDTPPTQTDLTPPTEQVDTQPVTDESVNTPEINEVSTAENSADEEVRESWTQIMGATVMEIDSENMVFSVQLDQSTEEVEFAETEEGEIQTEEIIETTPEILKVNVSELILTQKTITLSKDDSESIIKEENEVIAFDDIQPDDFIIIEFEGIENNEILNVQSVTKTLYETESEIAKTEPQEGDMLYLQGKISALDVNKNTIEYIYTYIESSDTETTFADKATVKFLEDGKIYQINDIDELNNLKNSQEISFTELEVGQEIYIKTQSMDNETNQIVILKQ